jgi:P4 family phage/plasmid primase-like protien
VKSEKPDPRQEDRQPADDRHPADFPDPTGGGRQGESANGAVIYTRGARLYREAGWTSPVPAWARGDKRPIAGFTGWNGPDPTDAQIEEWGTHRAGVNLLLRMNQGYVGLDADDYDGKTGGQTLAEIEKRTGVLLPPTWRSTSRLDDPVSGIYLYRVSDGFRSIGEVKFADLGIGHVEVIQRHHRTACAWPSVHPKTGNLYRWFRPDGSLAPEGVVPPWDEIPMLAPEHEDLLRMEKANPLRARRNRGRGEHDDEELPVYDIVGALTASPPSAKVAERMTRALFDIREGTNRHDDTRGHTMALLRYGSSGEPGVDFAVRELGKAFVAEVGPHRDGGANEAHHEFQRLITGAGHLLDDGENPEDDQRLCWKSPIAARACAKRIEAGYRAAGAPLAYYGENFFQWNGSAYTKRTDTDLRADLYQLLDDAYYYNAKGERVPWNPDRGKLDKILDAVKTPPVLVGPAVRPPCWLSGVGEPVIACANGLLRIRDRVLLAPSADFFTTFALPFGYDPAAEKPARLLRFLPEVMPGDPTAVLVLQEWFGYILSGRTDLQKALMLIGPTRCGKGTIDRLLRALVGADNHTGMSGTDLVSSFGMEQLITRTVATFSDHRMTMNGKKFVETVLRITGEDPVTVDQKNKKAWTGRLPTRLQFMSNEPPAMPDASGAVVGRMLAIWLPQSFYGREEIGLDATLRAELPGILNWALDGLDRLNRQSRFTELTGPNNIALREALLGATSPMREFVAECCDEGDAYEVAKEQFFEAWETWALRNGHKPGSVQTVSKWLLSQFGPGVVGKQTSGDHRKPVYRGLRLKFGVLCGKR